MLLSMLSYAQKRKALLSTDQRHIMATVLMNGVKDLLNNLFTVVFRFRETEVAVVGNTQKFIT